MSRSVLGLGILFVFLGLWIAVAPDQFVSVVDWESRQGLFIAAGMRIILGLFLVLSAPATRYPKGLKIFGFVVFVAGLLLLFVPIDMWARLMKFAFTDNLHLVRVFGGVFGTLFGAFLVFSARPRQAAE